MPRRFLVFVSAKHGEIMADLFRPERMFDVAMNDWTTDGICPHPAEYRFKYPWKFVAVNEGLATVEAEYEAIALLDDDIAVDADRINRLFLAGLSLGLRLWQPALDPGTPTTHYSYDHLLARPDSLARSVELVEIMCPFFTREAFSSAWWTFSQCESGWGLDYLWAEKVFRGQGMGVIDALPVKHCRPVSSGEWIMPNGLRPGDEFRLLREKFGLRCDIHSKQWTD
jgi:hypothetical protein